MRKKIAAANWKMHKTPAEAREFFTEFKKLVTLDNEQRDIIFFVSAFLLSAVADDAAPFAFGPQNVHWDKEGAFTGESSAYVAEKMGATYALAGHSERRQIFGENDEMIAKRAAGALTHSLTPMICVGETLAEREAARTEKVIAHQLEQGISKLPADAKFIVAYEPVWAIGTGKVATPEQAEEAHAFLRDQLKRLRGQSVADKTAILYGGSVKPDNAQTLASKPNIDGFLVGGASLKPKDFSEIVAAL